MFLLLLPALLITLACALHYHFTRNFKYWKSKNVPGPEPVPIFGNIKESTLRRKRVSEVYHEIYTEFNNEEYVGIYTMTTPALLVRDLDIMKAVLIKDFDVFIDRGIDLGNEGIGANLFSADVDTWRILRNRFTPLFTSGRLKNMLHLMLERGDIFMDYVDNITNEQSEHNVHALVQKYTISTISACAFGVDLDISSPTFDFLRKIDKYIFSVNIIGEIDMMYPGLMKLLYKYLLPAEVTDFFVGLVKTVLTQRDGKPTKRKDFMDLILELKQQGEIRGTKRHDTDQEIYLELTEDVISAQAFVFYAAGYETSATTMTFMLYQLALNPDIQDKLIKEIDETLLKYDGKITYEALNELDYMGMVFDETLRMYPILDYLQRSATSDYKLPGGVVLEKGTNVIISVVGIHYDEQYYPDPKKFVPERFSPENIKDKHSLAYLSFGAGPRNCIGMRFAKVQSRVCIVKLLSKYRVEPSANTEVDVKYDPYRVVVSPNGGMLLNLVPRVK